jgi:formylglycine-generating enzyme required for sulfatase activity
MPTPVRLRPFALLLLAGCSGCGGGPRSPSPEAVAWLAAKAAPESWDDLDHAHPGTRLRDPRTGIIFRRVPKGTFAMGDDEQPLEKPRHAVTLTRDWLLAETEVTVGQWQRWLDEHGGAAAALPSKYSAQHPITHVLFDEAVAFCRTYGYRLPTEAEWERACYGGLAADQGPWMRERTLTDYAWFQRNCDSSPQPVGTRAANPYGLFDMLGNVWEYCADWCGPYPPDGAMQTDPTGPPAPVTIAPFLHGGRVLRGGSWFSLPGPKPTLRVEEESEPGMKRNGFTGFRPARSLADS